MRRMSEPKKVFMGVKPKQPKKPKKPKYRLTVADYYEHKRLDIY